MHVVVDASAIAAVLFQEPEGATIEAHCAGETLIAPHLIDYELASACRKRIRKLPEDQVAVYALGDGLRRLDIRRVSAPPAEVLALSISTGLTAYDAAYLWVAIDRDAELVTLDRALANADRLLRGDPA